MSTSITPISAAAQPGLTPPTTSAAADQAPATSPLASAIAGLAQAVSALASVVQAMAGASQVGGGGPTNAAGGCSCGSGATDGAVAGVATNVAGGGATGAPSAPSTGIAPVQGPDAPAATAPPTPAGAAASTSSVRDRIVASARAELAKGVTEDAGANEDRAGNIKKYRAAVTGPNWAADRGPEEWCADFASWVWKDSGAAFGPKGTGEASTSTMVKQAKELGSWKTSDPKPGDMILFDWGGGRGTPNEAGVVDHVAIVDKVENGKVYIIGGNQSDALTAGSYALDDKRVLGFVNPPGA